MSSSRSSNAAWLTGTLSSVYSPPSIWKLRSVVVPRLPGDDVLVAGLHAGAEVERVRVVQTHLGERAGARLHERMVAVVVEGQVGASGDTSGQILQAFQQIGLGFDEGGGGDQSLGLGDRLGQWLRSTPLETRTCSHSRQRAGDDILFDIWNGTVHF